MEPKQNYAIPLSIVIAGCIIAAAIYFGGAKQAGPAKQPLVAVKTFTKSSPNDHTLGAPLDKAKFTLIAYSDLECPFCKIFHRSVLPLITNNPDVAFIFRHYPIDSNHKQARTEAEYAACIGKTAGQDAFWQFINSVFEATKSNDGLVLSTMPDLATKDVAKVADIDACVKAGDGKEIVNADEKTGSASGLTGTPFIIAIDNSTGKAISLTESDPKALTSPILKAFTEKLFSNWTKETARFQKELQAEQPNN